jgi:hypothetical protein
LRSLLAESIDRFHGTLIADYNGFPGWRSAVRLGSVFREPFFISEMDFWAGRF